MRTRRSGCCVFPVLLHILLEIPGNLVITLADGNAYAPGLIVADGFLQRFHRVVFKRFIFSRLVIILLLSRTLRQFKASTITLLFRILKQFIADIILLLTMLLIKCSLNC